MTGSKPVLVLGHELTEELFPKLYKLAVEDSEKISRIILLYKRHCLDSGDVSHVIETIERSEPVTILGNTEIGAIDYPAIYCWYRSNPADFEKFFGETVEKMWAGDKKLALRMTEDFLEKDLK